MDTGHLLADARQHRGLSIAELAGRTKISPAALVAIERNRMEDLPGGIYTRAHLRAYAREVGCDPEAVIRQYRAEWEEKVPAATSIVTQATSNSPVCSPGQVHAADIDAAERQRLLRHWLGAAVALAIAVVSVDIQWRASHRATDSPLAIEATAPLEESPTARTATLEVGTTGTLPGGRMPDSDVALRFDVTTTGPCWLSAVADGAKVVYRVMNTGEHARIEARGEVILRIGDPAHLQLMLNGTAARPLGAPGQPVTLHVTPQNYRTFLDRQMVDLGSNH